MEKAVEDTVTLRLPEMVGVPAGVLTRRMTNRPKAELSTPMK